MNFAFHQQTGRLLPLLSRTESNAGLHNDAIGLTFFFQQFLLTVFCFTEKAVIFAWLFQNRIVFALSNVQCDKRKPPAGYYKMNRLLQFTRAVWLAPPTGNHRVASRGANTGVVLYKPPTGLFGKGNQE